MRRRTAIGLLGGLLALPYAARGQEKVPRIGILDLGGRDPAPVLRNFREGLRRLGYEEGRNIAIEVHSAQGRLDALHRLAESLVNIPVDVIVAFQTPAALAAKQATATIPIVTVAGDPVATGLVASLSRPGGNVTGLSAATAEISAKNIEIIREAMPRARRVSVLLNAPDPFHKPFLDQIERSAHAVGIAITPVATNGAQGLDAGFADVERARPDAVIVQPSLPLRRAADLALRGKLPAISPISQFPEEGGLMAYASKPEAVHREAAVIVDKILKGRKPADLPVQLPVEFELTVNLKTAGAIGLTIPPTMLARADKVIE